MENAFKPIATKISEESYATLVNICQKKKLTLYEFLQMVVDVIIRYCDEQHQLSSTMLTLIHAFENLEGWKDAFTTVDPTTNPKISEATYYMSDSVKHGVRAVLVRYPFMGQPNYTYNIQTIAERMFCLVFPNMYKRLRMVGVELDTNTVIETIDKLINEYLLSDDERTLAEIFSDCRRSDNGKTMKDDGPYKRKMTKDMNTLFDNNQNINSHDKD